MANDTTVEMENTTQEIPATTNDPWTDFKNSDAYPWVATTVVLFALVILLAIVYSIILYYKICKKFMKERLRGFERLNAFCTRSENDRERSRRRINLIIFRR